MKNLLSFDFSMAKPAACLRIDGEYKFYSWPKDLTDKNKTILKNAGINIIDRADDIAYKDKIQSEIANASTLSNLIIDTLKPYLSCISYVGFEGLSYGSTGNVILSLAGWRFIFQYNLSQYVPLDNMYTYAPITIKKTAGCSKKGSKKADMINAFLKENTDFSHHISNNQQSFTTKGGNWVAHLDDLVDSYWVLRTLEDRL